MVTDCSEENPHTSYVTSFVMNIFFFTFFSSHHKVVAVMAAVIVVTAAVVLNAVLSSIGSLVKSN